MIDLNGEIDEGRLESSLQILYDNSNKSKKN